MIVSTHTSKLTHDYVMYGEVYKPTHTGDRYRDVQFDIMCFGDHGIPVNFSVQMPAILSVSGYNIIPQNASLARSLPNSNKWLSAEDDGIESIRYNRVIAQTASLLPDGVIAITTMFIYTLKWTLMNTIERHKARRVVR